MELNKEYEFKTKEEMIFVKLFINKEVQEIDINNMFSNCSNLISIDGISKLKKIKIISLNKMFYNCISLSSIPDFKDWEIKKYNPYLMFYNCISLSFFPYKNELDINEYDDLFLGLIITKYLKINNEITINNIIEDRGCVNLFGNECKINNKNREIMIIDGKDERELIACYKDEIKVNRDKNEIIIFYNNEDNNGKKIKIKLKLINKMKDIDIIIKNKELDLSKWNTINVTNMSNLFSSCTLSSLPDISKWNTINVKDMSNLFSSSKSIILA